MNDNNQEVIKNIITEKDSVPDVNNKYVEYGSVLDIKRINEENSKIIEIVNSRISNLDKKEEKLSQKTEKDKDIPMQITENEKKLPSQLIESGKKNPIQNFEEKENIQPNKKSKRSNTNQEYNQNLKPNKNINYQSSSNNDGVNMKKSNFSQLVKIDINK